LSLSVRLICGRFCAFLWEIDGANSLGSKIPCQFCELSQKSMEGLSYLLKAPSKKVVDQIFVEVYKNKRGPVAQQIITSLTTALQLTEAQATEVEVTYFFISFTPLARSICSVH
jgi:hypothetical protein